MHLPFWLTTALLLPVMLYQGKRVRRTTPRLPEAAGPQDGQYGDGPPEHRLLVIGESTAAGVGVDSHDQGLASQLALHLHQRTGRTIAWHTWGINGITMGGLLGKLATAELPKADTVLLSMGVNDTTGLTPRRRFRQQLIELHQRLMPEDDGPLYLICVPPMHRFTALPAPLRQLMGWRAHQLDRVYARLARAQPADFVHLRYPTVTDPDMLARDGYHPGVKGYAYIGDVLSEALVGRVVRRVSA